MATPKSGTVHQFPQIYNNSEVTEQQSCNNYYYNNNHLQKNDQNLQIDTIKVAFRLNFGYEMPVAILRQCQMLLNTTQCTADLIIAIIEYTVCTAPRPAWPYARAVLNRQMAAGVFTAEAFAQSCAAFEAKAVKYPSTKRVLEQNYTQREYDPAEVNGPSLSDLKEARAL